ncbi:hypothetical protein [Gorillibacterium sp. sgz5001074]|uniref:hypothetical protein n=1 Tax=Gorillibacterium sp. sgz5001074 TaxID=3446695 RepID=UPI003F675992
MKERNAYTYFLAGIGGASILLAVGTIILSEQPWVLLLVTLGTSLVGLFPIQLPNRFWYAFFHVPSLFLLVEYDWKIAILPSVISMLTFRTIATNKLPGFSSSGGSSILTHQIS